MSLFDDIRKALQSFSKQDAMKGHFRSCEACSFFKNGYCTQIQPPSKILNVYEAQLCIYYTVEQPQVATQQAVPVPAAKERGTIKDIETNRQNLLANFNFGTGDLTGWTIVYGVPTVKSDGGSLSYVGFYVCSLKRTNNVTDHLLQSLSKPTHSNDITDFYVLAKTASGNHDCTLVVYYTDATVTVHTFAVTSAYQKFLVTPTANKIVGSINLIGSYTDEGSEIYVDEVSILADLRVKQDTRTNLKAQTEREDLISLGGVVSPNNVGVVIVAGTANQKVKVYDAEYEAGVDGLHYFYFGTDTTPTTKRFLSASTKGKNSKTIKQPRIGDAGDGLYLFSAVSETNMPYDVGYVKEA